MADIVRLLIVIAVGSYGAYYMYQEITWLFSQPIRLTW